MWQHYLAAQMTEHCTTGRQPFSVITSSHPNEALAGILAGFTMTSTAFILGRPVPSERLVDNKDTGSLRGKESVPTQTLTLFGVGVLILGLDAYLYGMITGTAPPIDSHGNVLGEAEHACAVAWTQAMPASSMLAVGACFMVAGLGWILGWHIGFHDVRSKAVAYVPGTITGITVLTTSLMLVRNANLYANVMSDFGPTVPAFWKRALWGAFVLFAVWVVIIVGLRTIGLLLHVGGGSDLETVLTLRKIPLVLATLGGSILAITGPALASFVTDTELLRDSNTGVPTMLGVVLAMLLCVLPAFLILGPIAMSVPGPDLAVSRREIKKWRSRKRNRM